MPAGVGRIERMGGALPQRASGMPFHMWSTAGPSTPRSTGRTTGGRLKLLCPTPSRLAANRVTRRPVKYKVSSCGRSGHVENTTAGME